MANTVFKRAQGSFWPLGVIVVPTPGTPVNIMSLVDSSLVNAPEAATSATSNEYTVVAQQIFFQAFIAGAAPPKLTASTGNVYVIMKPIGGGAGDTGVVISVIPSGQSLSIGSAALNRNVFNPYEIYLDVDTASDGAIVSLVIQ